MVRACGLLMKFSLSVSVAVCASSYGHGCADDAHSDETVTNSIGMKLVRIPAGSFGMGSSETYEQANKDERPQHQIKITASIFMGTFEVTQSQYEKMMGDNPSYFSPSGEGQDKVAGLNTSSFPVEKMFWQDAVDFCNKLSELPSEKKAGRIYRLPTEAEWEYACRAGSNTLYHFGDVLSANQANFNGQLSKAGAEQIPFLSRPTTVGSYPPNEFGLYDMHGNVWEWCADWYRSSYYETSPESDPPGAESGGDRSVRGGSWADDAFNCRSAYRYNILPAYRFQTRGFRVVMTIATDTEENIPPADATVEVNSTVVLTKEAVERERAFQADIIPFLKEYCFDCHSGQDPDGEFALDIFDHSSTIVTTGHKSWKKVVDKLLAEVMPPVDANQPPRAEKNSVAKWISARLSQIDCSGQIDPGHETIRRLNRVEYRNTIRDLLGVDYEPASAFPTDDVGAGGDSLSLPTLLMERYLSAAEEISRMAIEIETQRNKPLIFVRPDESLSHREASRKVLKRLTTRAYRRPVTDVELERLLRLTDSAKEQGRNFEDAIQLAVQAILVSPHFLFKVEQPPTQTAPETIEPLNEFEFATRLSYFLWSSMPDTELMDLAQGGLLRENLDAQLVRMIEDRKSSGLVTNFTSSWLELDKLDSFQPDQIRFANYDKALRAAMRNETEKFFEAILREDRSLLDLMNADFTFVNERLARHYGIDGVDGPEFRRISLSNTSRGGLLTQASILTLTSNPTRTSPVKRGKWILSNILGAPPPAPPPGVSDLAGESDASELVSLRKRLEVHRKNPRCAACHEPMDSLGFALEHFDVIGRWRTTENQAPIDATGSLPTGETFSGAQQLTTLLRKERKKEFVRCLAAKMLAYALGRGLEYYDHCTVTKIVESLERDDYKFSTLLREIVKSDAFQNNRPKSP